MQCSAKGHTEPGEEADAAHMAVLPTPFQSRKDDILYELDVSAQRLQIGMMEIVRWVAGASIDYAPSCPSHNMHGGCLSVDINL